jgi:Zn-dependent alcohol dehydrogenase
MLSVHSTEAAILTSSKKPLDLANITLPRELQSGQVLVKLITSGICGAQINEIDAIKGPDLFLPHLLGHEGYGEVIEIGPGVKKIKPGDKVILHWRKSSGIEALPAKYFLGDQVINAGWVTTFSKHSIVSENRVTRIPDTGINKTLLPLLGCALTTSFGAVTYDTKLNKSHSIIVFGAGGLGLLIIKFASTLKASSIIVIDKDSNKLKTAIELGATSVIHFISKEDVLSQLRQLERIRGIDFAYETTGSSDGIEISFDQIANDGKVLLIGTPNHESLVTIPILPLHFGKTLVGSHGGSTNPDRDIPILVDFLASNELDLSLYPIESVGLDGINSAINNIRKGSVGRKVIEF